jgi:prophage DNA circulation protein
MYGDSYKSEDSIKGKLYESLSGMRTRVSKLGKNINVKDASDGGKEKTITSPELTRIYKVILVVPDNADLTTVKSAAEAFEREQRASGTTVEVEVKTGYGSPTDKKSETETKAEGKTETNPET